ncbi:MAG: hypothetical protein K1X68_05325 [Saprospiraceae bacterium]|nr:hypothetical protein [Saprospiraceae bacterium]HMW38562.1 hypothetical protein [Saprospiraceae bacterium]HMX88763.1 hypothetical protein [Saprospiraceae bacterium]HMZ40463.1 hypothetical protein [Saprospiraceae bacterium]HNA64332.1 hypothetical protein [Saprospiraceae bacterium]
MQSNIEMNYLLTVLLHEEEVTDHDHDHGHGGSCCGSCKNNSKCESEKAKSATGQSEPELTEIKSK